MVSLITFFGLCLNFRVGRLKTFVHLVMLLRRSKFIDLVTEKASTSASPEFLESSPLPFSTFYSAILQKKVFFSSYFYEILGIEELGNVSEHL